MTSLTAGTWHRLHPLSPLVRAGRQFTAVVIVLFTIALANQRQERGDLIGDIVVVVVVLAGGVVSWLVTRWQVADGVLRIDTGLVRRDSRRFPLSQVQAIDVVQTGLARVLGLAELRLRVVGGDASRGARLACLSVADAKRVRQQLLTMAGTTAPAAAAPAAASLSDPGRDATVAVAARELFRVRPERLAVAVLLSPTGAVTAVTIAVIAAIAAAGLPGVASSLTAVALGAVLGTWRQFNSEYGTAVAAGPDGLQLRSGLVQTAAETIRPGRVQGVRLVEPLLWRAFGWCRVEVDVAGPSQRGENRTQARRLRALVPVGTRREAEDMITELLGARPVPSLRPPRRARWKAPLSYHFLGFGADDRYVVAARGRICRQTTWVPLEKVQSVRWVQGPLQRRLTLTSVHLDVAGRRVSASIEDRDAAEAADLFGRLPDLARAARARSA